MSPSDDPPVIANALRLAQQVQRDTPSLVRAAVNRPNEPSVSSVVRRGSPIAPHAPDPSPAALAAARADTKVGDMHVNRRLDTIVPPSERVAGGVYSAGAPGGGRWADLPPDTLSKPGLGFSLPPRNHNHPPETLPGLGVAPAAPPPSDDDHLRRLWDEAVSESSAAAKHAVANHGVRPTFTADDWHNALKLPFRDHLWYELSGEKLAENLPGLTHSEHMKMLDVLGATSARAEPSENLERTLGVMSQHLRGVPVDVDLQQTGTVKQALARDHKHGTSALPGNKTGHFSDTIALAGGVPARYPISVNDVWVGRMFGVPDEVMSTNQSLHEPMAKYFNKLRDFYNERFKDQLPFPYQSWNFQAGAWVHLRSKDAGKKQGDAYHQVWDNVIGKLKAAGVPGVQGDKITRQALMDPRFADALRVKTGPWRNAPKATVELGTKLTDVGARARALYEDAIQRGDELSQKEYLSGITTAMYASARGKDHPWERLKKAITGDVTGAADITRIGHPSTDSPFDAGGTFEGDVSPNIRIPLKDMDDSHIDQFNSVAGHHLIQAAMAASTVLGADPGSAPRPGHTRSYGVFVPTSEQIPDNLLRVFARELKIRNHDTSFQRHPNGYQFDVIPDFSDWRNPRGIDVHDLDEAYGAALRPHYGVGKYTPNDFKSTYTMAEDYGTHRANLTKRIRDEYVAQSAKDAGVKPTAAKRALRAETYPADLPRGGKKAWDVYRARHDHLAQAEEGFKALAQRVNDAHASFITRAEMRAGREAKQRVADARSARVPRADGGRLPATAGERLVRALGGMADCGPAQGNGLWGSGGTMAAPIMTSQSQSGGAPGADGLAAMPLGATANQVLAPGVSGPGLGGGWTRGSSPPPDVMAGYAREMAARPAQPTMPFQQQSSGKGAGGAGGLSDSGKGAGDSNGLTSLNAPPSYMGSQSTNSGGPMQASQQSYGIGNMLSGFMSRFGFADGGAVADDGTEWRNVNVTGEGASKSPVEVAVNPTHDEITRLVKGSDRGSARLSKDTDGNVYAWDANRALHDQVQRSMGFKPDRKAASVIGQMPIARLHQGKLRLTDVMGMSFPGGVTGWHRDKRPARAGGGEVDDPAPGIGHNQPPAEMVTPPSPSYIKPAPVDDYKRKLSPLGLYSHAAEAAWKQPQMKASPDQFKATLINRHGVKPDEFRWTGYDEAFKGRPMVTKREVRDHFLKNQPQLDERRYSDDDYDYDSDSGASGEPRYKDYALPGGKNYRELVVHMPKKTDPAVEKPLKEAHRATQRQLSQAMIAEQRAGDELRHLFQFKQTDDPTIVAAMERYHAARTAHETARQAYDDAARKWSAVKDNGLQYQSSHWDEPNVVAHLRVSDRKTAPPAVVQHVVHNYVSGNRSQPFNTRDEAEAFIRAQPAALRDKLAPSVVSQPTSKPQKILHLEELQSDWGQEGRDHGFKRDLTPEETAELRAIHAHVMSGERLTPAQYERDRALTKIAKGVPVAPYVGSTEKWTELGLKRALHEAATGGYDKLVITPGEEQAKRYDLGNHVDHISYVHQGNGLYSWSARKAGNEMASQRGQTLEQVAAHIGRDVAERMKQNAGREVGAPEGSGELRGLDLKVGGAGMKKYYDRDLPRVLEKLARQHDPAARVALHGHAIEGADPMRKTPDNWRAFKSWVSAHPDYAGMAEDRVHHVFSRGRAGASEVGGNAHKMLAEYLAAQVKPKLHSLDITPAMRASILKGQKSFASGGAVDPPGGKGFAEDLPYDDPGIVFVPDLDRVFGENSRIIGQKARYGTGKTGNEMFGFGNQDTLSAMSEGSRGAVNPPPSFPRWAGKQDKPFFSLHTHPSGSVHASRGDLAYRGMTNPDRHYMMLEAMSGPHNRTMIAPPRSLQGGFGPLAFKDYAGQMPFSRQATYDTLMKLNKSLGLDERDATMAGALVNLHLAKKGAPVFMDKRATPKGGKATVQEMLDDYVRHMKKYAWQDTPGLAKGGAVATGKRISERISEGVTDRIYRKVKAEIPVFGRYKAGGST